MRLLRETESENAAVFEGARGALLDRFVAAHPDRAEPENRHLPGVPVLEAVEAEDLGELADPPGVPAGVRGTVAGRRAHRREDPLARHEVEEVPVPAARVVVLLQPALSLLLEEVDGLAHHLARAVVGIAAGEPLRVAGSMAYLREPGTLRHRAAKPQPRTVLSPNSGIWRSLSNGRAASGRPRLLVNRQVPLRMSTARTRAADRSGIYSESRQRPARN